MGFHFGYAQENWYSMINRLALGTVQFGLDYGIVNKSGRVRPDEVASILNVAADHGIDLLDTAISYGESERVLGVMGVADWKIVSKLPPVPDGISDVPAWIKNQIERSLVRLGAKRLYGLLLHRPDQLIGPFGPLLLEALEGMKREGLVQKIGISVYAPGDLVRLSQVMHIELVQIPMSIFDRRLIESGWAGRLKQQGTEIHVRSVFLQGLLLMPAAYRPQKFSRWSAVWAIWDQWLNHTSVTPLQACLRYALGIDEVDKVLVGVDSANQLREILVASEGELDSLPAWPQQLDLDLINPTRWVNL